MSRHNTARICRKTTFCSRRRKTEAKEKNALRDARARECLTTERRIQRGNGAINYSAVECRANGEKKTHATGERTTLLTICQRLTDKKIIGKTIYHFFLLVEAFSCVANGEKKCGEEVSCGTVSVARGAGPERGTGRRGQTHSHTHPFIGIYFSVCFSAHRSAFHMDSVEIAQTYNIQPTNLIRRRSTELQKNTQTSARSH